jgi:hypothetical protein
MGFLFATQNTLGKSRRIMLISNSAAAVSVLELKRLLVELAEHKVNVCIRLRMLGELWQANHSRVIRVTDNGTAMLDELTNKLLFIQDLNNVMQFELDGQFQLYKPNYHYTVKLA